MVISAVVHKPETKMKCVLLALLPALIAATSLEDIANVNEGSGRQAKLFFVSSSSTTSTVSTVTYCYTGAAAITTPCKRKRSLIQQLNNNSGISRNNKILIFEQSYFRKWKGDYDSSITICCRRTWVRQKWSWFWTVNIQLFKNLLKSVFSEGRFFLYWLTTTSTTTTTVFTATSTYSVVGCTPAVDSLCGWQALCPLQFIILVIVMSYLFFIIWFDW